MLLRFDIPCSMFDIRYSKQKQRMRLRAQAKEAGAELLVTSCPYCITNFEDSRLALEDGGAPEIKDLTELVYESLAGSETS